MSLEEAAVAEWQNIPPHQMLLRGNGGYLSMTVDSYVHVGPCVPVLGMTIELGVERCGLFRDPIRLLTGWYGGLATARQELIELRRTGEGVATFDSIEQVAWTISPLVDGSGDQLLVDVTATTFIYEQTDWPTGLSQSLKDPYSSAGACVRYAFVTSRIAEPWMEDFLRQMDELNDMLNLW